MRGKVACSPSAGGSTTNFLPLLMAGLVLDTTSCKAPPVSPPNRNGLHITPEYYRSQSKQLRCLSIVQEQLLWLPKVRASSHDRFCLGVSRVQSSRHPGCKSTAARLEVDLVHSTLSKLPRVSTWKGFWDMTSLGAPQPLEQSWISLFGQAAYLKQANQPTCKCSVTKGNQDLVSAKVHWAAEEHGNE